MGYKLKEELLGNYVDGNLGVDIGYLFDTERINSRARSVEILNSFGEEENQIYLYDFLAYLFKYSENIGNVDYDEYIWCLLKYITVNDYIMLNSNELYNFVNYGKSFSISSILKSFLYCIYIYNEAIIENNHQIDSPAYNLNGEEIAELLEFNLRLFEEQEKLKDDLLYLRYDEFLNSDNLNDKKSKIRERE